MLSIYQDLRVILMSATIDVTLFTQYFNNCPVIHVEGRTFPVQTYFLEDCVTMLKFSPSLESIRREKKKRKEEGDDEDSLVVTGGNSDENMNIMLPGARANYPPTTIESMSNISERDINIELLIELLKHIKNKDIKGAILIFLPGWNVIFSILKFLQDHPIFGSPAYRLLPLHSQLPREDQHRVFERAPPNVTKIILSTNIAETSVTIDDVVFVIDSCKAKVKLFTSHNNMTTFSTIWGSRSNLAQRKGRAGRVREGICYYLCSKRRYDSLEENITPEMLRTPLHETALTIKLLRLGGIGHFLSKAPEPPPIDAVIEAQALLHELNCLDDSSELTPLGRILAKLPIDPRLGKMIVLGTVFGSADALAVIAAQSANLSEVFDLGPFNKRLAPTQRAFSCQRNSDHFAILNAFSQWDRIRQHRGESAEIEFCQQRMLSMSSLRVTSEAKNQLIQVLIQCGFPEDNVYTASIMFKGHNPIVDTLAGLLCVGLYPNVCYHKEKRKVLTTESKAALVHKASVNCTKFETSFPYPFFIFGEKIRTRAIACKCMTMVSPIHLLLFGSRKVDLINGIVRLDNWINLDMDPNAAAAIVALRPSIENLIVKVSENPEGFFPMAEIDQRLVQLVKDLCTSKETGNQINQNWQPQEEESYEGEDSVDQYGEDDDYGDDEEVGGVYNETQTTTKSEARGTKRSHEDDANSPDGKWEEGYEPMKVMRTSISERGGSPGTGFIQNPRGYSGGYSGGTGNYQGHGGYRGRSYGGSSTFPPGYGGNSGGGRFQRGGNARRGWTPRGSGGRPFRRPNRGSYGNNYPF